MSFIQTKLNIEPLIVKKVTKSGVQEYVVAQLESKLGSGTIAPTVSNLNEYICYGFQCDISFREYSAWLSVILPNPGMRSVITINGSHGAVVRFVAKILLDYLNDLLVKEQESRAALPDEAVLMVDGSDTISVDIVREAYDEDVLAESLNADKAASNTVQQTLTTDPQWIVRVNELCDKVEGWLESSYDESVPVFSATGPQGVANYIRELEEWSEHTQNITIDRLVEEAVSVIIWAMDKAGYEISEM